MRNKKYLILTGITAGCILLAGCGKKEPAAVSTVQEVSISTAPEVTESAQQPVEGELVDMQTNEEEELANVIGTKSAAANRIELENQLGKEIAELYVRPHTEQYISGDSWKEELLQTKFTLQNGEKAAYYYEPQKQDESGQNIITYDLRVSFVNENEDEYFFRDLPLNSIGTLKFCVDSSTGSMIPYVKYTTTSNASREVSTLEDVKKRLTAAATYTYSYDEEDTDNSTETEETPTPVPEVTATPVEPSDEDPSYDESDTDEGRQQAAQYIGQSLDTLIGSMGAPSSSEYADEPETGRTGYHYYSTFTVSTSIDEDGNEVVAGVW